MHNINYIRENPVEFDNFMKTRVSKLSAEAHELLPLHVAVIMDGNGRWAKERGLPRVEGHRRGAESARTIIKAASEVGVKYLTLYTFSVENWNRPRSEVDAIMRYLAQYLKSEAPELNKNNVRLEAIGQIHRLPEAVRNQLEKSKHALDKNNGLPQVKIALKALLENFQLDYLCVTNKHPTKTLLQGSLLF